MADKKDKSRLASQRSSSDEATPVKKKAMQFKKVSAELPKSKSMTIHELGQFLVKQIAALNDNIESLSESNEFAHEQSSEALQELAEIKTKLCVIDSLQEENQRLKSENVQLTERLLTLECYQRRENIVFEGFAEQENEKEADCREKVKNALQNINGLDNLQISRCHRLGKKRDNFKRGIICHIQWYGHKNIIKKNRDKLPNGIKVHDDYPTEVQDRRKALRPYYSAAMKHNDYKNDTIMVRDKLIVKGKAYTFAPVNNLHELPAAINPRTECEKSNENTLVFFGIGSVFSNFHPSPMTIDNVPYSCNEEYIESQKAALFNDDVTEQRIKNAGTPHRMKALGSSIKGYNETQWEGAAKDIARKGAIAKFTQNPHLAKALKETNGKIIAEATREKMWGTGVGLHEAGALIQDTWTGYGIMGDILMDIRDNILPK